MKTTARKLLPGLIAAYLIGGTYTIADGLVVRYRKYGRNPWEITSNELRYGLLFALVWPAVVHDWMRDADT